MDARAGVMDDVRPELAKVAAAIPGSVVVAIAMAARARQPMPAW